MNWASWTLIIMTLISFGIVCYNHGKPKKEKYDVWMWLVSATFQLLLIYFSGGLK